MLGGVFTQEKDMLGLWLGAPTVAQVGSCTTDTKNVCKYVNILPVKISEKLKSSPVAE